MKISYVINNLLILTSAFKEVSCLQDILIKVDVSFILKFQKPYL